MVAEVKVSGPMFDGRAEAIITRFCRFLEQTIGDEGKTLIKHRLPAQYKYTGHSGGSTLTTPRPDNAGYYESQINVDHQINQVAINDRDVVYGPWLEGVGSRNAPVTRFKGYHTFRVVNQELIMTTNEIADRILPAFMEELNA